MCLEDKCEVIFEITECFNILQIFHCTPSIVENTLKQLHRITLLERVLFHTVKVTSIYLLGSGFGILGLFCFSTVKRALESGRFSALVMA